MAINPGRTSAWGARMSRALAEISGLQCAPGSLAEYRDSARKSGKRLPDELEDQECSICFAGAEIEGISRANGSTFVFEAESALPAMPVGSEMRLKCREGSLRCLVLGAEENRLRLARAPNRCERRRHTRHPVEGVAVVHFPEGREAEASLTDLSEGGAGIVSGCLLEVGEPVRLFLRVAGLKRISYEVDGWVANCKPGSGHGFCIGIQFRDLPEDLKDEIRRMRQPKHPE
ncbi:MAG: PilZ domain-containing protein [Armatimonadetes bacterium]|nr:MAG: PilZ domain-containing protein [Armatimonadota bacterium]